MTVTTTAFASFDGAPIAVHEIGEGRPTLMLHGFIATAELNWILPGIADRVAAAGRRVIMPDLRGHGGSAAPTDPATWSPDILPRDQEALIKGLGLSDYDLVGYSLGARTAVRMLVRGATPERVVLGGMGDSGVMAAGMRAAMFEDSIRNGEKAADPKAGKIIQARIRQGGFVPEALLGVLSSFVPTTEDELRKLDRPILAVCGELDQDNGSPERLAELLPRGVAQRVPGTHLSAVAEPALAEAIVAFLEG
ncbi:alpha/beta fold hydrolase [Caulobacter mirabilis]|uniref:Alpha/beta hydrolase n=1 Tax=Caulobacter mirabilis TaxID=69666 RepID=A0A2D2B2A4_9CAUL|nr:alpha/beta fold hydrolase [Caulobacter mirabilis]ATQ44382.1 alpha/beta hydrolase [Caulobacter mirabilis]